MNDIQIFDNKEFGQIRTIEIDGEPWFVGRDMATALGYGNPNDALSKHVDIDDKDLAKCDTLGGNQQMIIVNESGMYSLILGSKLTSAKKFKRWITSPKAEFFDAVAGSKKAISMEEVAKILSYPGIGRNKLFEILRNQNILQSDNIPYQKYIDSGYFRVIEQKYNVGDEVRINIKTLVFQKGVDFIRKTLDKVTAA